MKEQWWAGTWHGALWEHLLSIFEVCFEGVAETFGVFHKLLFLVFQGLYKQRKHRKIIQNQGNGEMYAYTIHSVYIVHACKWLLLTLRFWYWYFLMTLLTVSRSSFIALAMSLQETSDTGFNNQQEPEARLSLKLMFGQWQFIHVYNQSSVTERERELFMLIISTNAPYNGCTVYLMQGVTGTLPFSLWIKTYLIWIAEDDDKARHKTREMCQNDGEYCTLLDRSVLVMCKSLPCVNCSI